MHKSRSSVSIRVVPLAASTSNDVSVGTTVTERLTLVWELTQEGWALAGKTLPVYARSSIPVRVVALLNASHKTP
jgi:hypothetical protein